jgi:hypothetical protein
MTDAYTPDPEPRPTDDEDTEFVDDEMPEGPARPDGGSGRRPEEGSGSGDLGPGPAAPPPGEG